jgi:hypothetical protein
MGSSAQARFAAYSDLGEHWAEQQLARIRQRHAQCGRHSRLDESALLDRAATLARAAIPSSARKDKRADPFRHAMLEAIDVCARLPADRSRRR